MFVTISKFFWPRLGTVAVSAIKGGCWTQGQTYLPSFRQGQEYKPEFKQGQEYLPGFRSGQKEC